MAYRSLSARRYAKKSRRNFFITLILITLLLYATIQWILPGVITGLGLVTGIFRPSQKPGNSISDEATLAPPILNIPFEATNTAQIDIKGYAAADSKVTLYLDNEAIGTVDAGSDGNFTFSGVNLSLGTNNIYAKTIDDKDRESLPSKTFKVNYDNEKPPLNITEPEDNKNIQGGDKRVKISGNTEANAQIFINDSQTIVNKDGNFSTELSLSDGENNFTIKAIDLAGNYIEIVRRVTFQP